MRRKRVAVSAETADLSAALAVNVLHTVRMKRSDRCSLRLQTPASDDAQTALRSCWVFIKKKEEKSQKKLG
jgi:hypothetical protein